MKDGKKKEYMNSINEKLPKKTIMKKPKIFAFHLPQFHAIAENNEWWGEGFTEWTNTRKAQKNFNWQRQPRIPLHENYYDLTDPETIKWQGDLAGKHGVDGFCFYHYYFNDGYVLLDQPLKLFLQDKSINISFCLSWANEAWTRSWEGDRRTILIDQNYGAADNWIKHVDYLADYFSDERYYRIDGKPVFLIYRPDLIDNLDEMISCMNKHAIKKGFQGIYFIATLRKPNQELVSGFDEAVRFEPFYSIYSTGASRRIFSKLPLGLRRYLIQFAEKVGAKLLFFLGKNATTYDYDIIYNKLIGNAKREPGKLLGAFVDWDNTARRGAEATLFKNVTVEKFTKYFEELYKISADNEVEAIFINAWNEWAEGTYLEPDTDNHHQHLEALKKIVGRDC